MKCSYFISDANYEQYDSPDHTSGNDDYLGREDANGDCWKCCMSAEDADKCIADHTNEDGAVDYDGLNKDLGLEPGTLDENSHRVDFETEGEIRNTEKGGVNDNGQCTGDGQLPGGYSDLEAKNVPRENAVDRGKIDDNGPDHDNLSSNDKVASENEGAIKGDSESKGNDESNPQSQRDSEDGGMNNIGNESEGNSESKDKGNSDSETKDNTKENPEEKTDAPNEGKNAPVAKDGETASSDKGETAAPQESGGQNDFLGVGSGAPSSDGGEAMSGGMDAMDSGMYR